jgi:hypothetical protein
MDTGKFIARKIKVMVNIRIYVTNRTRIIVYVVVSVHNGHPNNFQNSAPQLKTLTIINLTMRKQLQNLVQKKLTSCYHDSFCRIGIAIKKGVNKVCFKSVQNSIFEYCLQVPFSCCTKLTKPSQSGFVELLQMLIKWKRKENCIYKYVLFWIMLNIGPY